MPVKVRYYNCLNNGFGIIVWPQIRSNHNTENKLWDGRDHSGYKLNITQDVTVDLNGCNLPQGTTFILACNTFDGPDGWDSGTVYEYDSTANLTAYGQAEGGVWTVKLVGKGAH
ncbi:hypothetical protein HWV62_3098 [Athelia sp. TMB]|nr:hypothetical protein HWV62_29815 [Athelia sp. TMB]KAF7977662.1 hypothetical protein HWV62_3098 [Athelia sp. TMB]